MTSPPSAPPQPPPPPPTQLPPQPPAQQPPVEPPARLQPQLQPFLLPLPGSVCPPPPWCAKADALPNPPPLGTTPTHIPNFGEVLDQGACGRVWRGTFLGRQAAIKQARCLSFVQQHVLRFYVVFVGWFDVSNLLGCWYDISFAASHTCKFWEVKLECNSFAAFALYPLQLPQKLSKWISYNCRFDIIWCTVVSVFFEPCTTPLCWISVLNCADLRYHCSTWSGLYPLTIVTHCKLFEVQIKEMKATKRTLQPFTMICRYDTMVRWYSTIVGYDGTMVQCYNRLDICFNGTFSTLYIMDLSSFFISDICTVNEQYSCLFEYYISGIVDFSSFICHELQKQFLITINRTNHSCWFIPGSEDTNKLHNQTIKQYYEISGKFPSQ